MDGGLKDITKKMDGQLVQMQNMTHMKNKILQIVKVCIKLWKVKSYLCFMINQKMEYLKDG